MKARVVGTDKFIDVTVRTDDRNGKICGYENTDPRAYFPNHIFELYQIEEHPIDWEQRKFELVKTAMVGMFSNISPDIGSTTIKLGCETVIQIANEMVEQLQADYKKRRR